MNFDFVLNNEEKAVFDLRALYEKYGYFQYKMSKFEEYELYVKNKAFLVSDNVITFTDTDGKLMALKPDVTLSIIKNRKDTSEGLQKVYYNENVYRVGKGTKSFKEIMQVGLECLGNVDDYAVTEVISLAAKSLAAVSESYVLDISSLDVVSCVMEEAGLSEEGKKRVIAFLAEKNAKGVFDVCKSENVCEKCAKALKSLVTVYGTPEKVKDALSGLCTGEKSRAAAERLLKIVTATEKLCAEKNLRIDFSVVNDMNYYNGIVFKGFVEGIPSGILSGGQYDNLMGKMGKKSRAIGFAVYLDELYRLTYREREYDADVALEYGDAELSEVCEAVKKIIDGGETVFARKKLPENIKCKRRIELKKEEASL